MIEDANEEQLGKALPDAVIRQLDQHLSLLGPPGDTRLDEPPRTCRQCSGPSTRSCVTPGGDGVPGGVLASGASRWTQVQQLDPPHVAGKSVPVYWIQARSR